MLLLDFSPMPPCHLGCHLTFARLNNIYLQSYGLFSGEQPSQLHPWSVELHEWVPASLCCMQTDCSISIAPSIPQLKTLFVWVEAKCPCQLFINHVWTVIWAKQVLNHGDEVSCSCIQHSTPGEIQACNQVIKSLTLCQLS